MGVFAVELPDQCELLQCRRHKAQHRLPSDGNGFGESSCGLYLCWRTDLATAFGTSATLRAVVLPMRRVTSLTLSTPPDRSARSPVTARRATRVFVFGFSAIMVLVGLGFFVTDLPLTRICRRYCWLNVLLNLLLGDRGAKIVIGSIFLVFAAVLIRFAVRIRSQTASRPAKRCTHCCAISSAARPPSRTVQVPLTRSLEAPPSKIEVDGLPAFPFDRHIQPHEGYPIPDCGVRAGLGEFAGSGDLEAELGRQLKKPGCFTCAKPSGMPSNTRVEQRVLLPSGVECRAFNARLHAAYTSKRGQGARRHRARSATRQRSASCLRRRRGLFLIRFVLLPRSRLGLRSSAACTSTPAAVTA